MASTYSTNLRVELMANGENSTTWGSKTNVNLNLLEQAISGVASVAMTDADYTLTTSNALADEARNAVVTMTGTLTQARNVIVPSVDKQYVFKNSTTGGFSIVVKTAAGTGVTVPNGETVQVYCDATNVLLAETGGATTAILVGGGVGSVPVWTAATGSGAPVRATSPTLVTPNLGTPSTLVGTNITGTAAGLTAGTVTTNANLTGHVTSVGNAAVLGSFTVAQLSAAISDANISGTNTGDQTITLTGDVTGSGTGSFAATIANDAVTYAKMQNVSATDKLLGRSTAGAGDVEEITCTAAGRALLDDADAATMRATLAAAPLASPALTGTPTAPTAAGGTNTTQLATTAFVQAAVTALINASPAALDTLNELAAALGNDANFAATVTASLALKAPLASPAFTGAPTVPTAAPGTSSTQAASTAFVAAAVAEVAGVAIKQIQPISASVAASALTISASALSLDFRSTTMGSGTVTTVSGTPANLVISSGSTLGTVSGQQSRIAVLALNNAGTIELAAINVAGGNDLTETGVISTTAEGGAGAADSASVVYSTTARSNLAYRVLGYIESTQATAGTWATAPSTIQGAGGQACTAMSSVGHGQVWAASGKAAGTTYYNTTGKPIQLSISMNCGVGSTPTLTVTGPGSAVTVCYGSNANASGTTANFMPIIPPGHSYLLTLNSATVAFWAELR